MVGGKVGIPNGNNSRLLFLGVTLGFAFFGGAALLGHPDLIGQAPFFSTLVLAIVLTVPMAHGCAFATTGGDPRWR